MRAKLQPDGTILKEIAPRDPEYSRLAAFLWATGGGLTATPQGLAAPEPEEAHIPPPERIEFPKPEACQPPPARNAEDCPTGLITVRRPDGSEETLQKPKALIPVPPIAQENNWCCLAVCAMACAQLRGVGPSTQDAWIEELGTTKKHSTDPAEIVRYLRELGLDVEMRQDLTLDDLRWCWCQGDPVIVMVREYDTEGEGEGSVKASQDYGHGIVVTGVDLGHVFVMDPSEPNIVEGDDSAQAPGLVPIKEQDFLDRWHDRQYVRLGIRVGKLCGSSVKMSVGPLDKQVRLSQDTDEPETDDYRDLALFYAELWNLLGQPSLTEVEHADAELADGDYLLWFDNRTGQWNVSHAADEKGGVQLSAAHSPKGGVTIGGKFYRGGQFIPASELAKASPEVKEKIESAKQAREEKRRGRGSVDVEKLRARLTEHASHELTKDEQRSARSAFNALHRHHGELTVHRLEEIAGDLQKALDNLPEDEEGQRQQLSRRLKAIDEMLGMAAARGVHGQVEPTKLLTHQKEEAPKVAPTPTIPEPAKEPTHAEIEDRLVGRDAADSSGQPAPAQPKGTGGPGRPELGGTDSGQPGGAGAPRGRARIVTAREHLVKPADPGLVPEGIRKHLNDAQVQGAASAIRSMDQHGGFVLSDGTGVGKTRQELAVAQTAAQKGKKVLIVSPAEVLKPDWKKGTVSGSFANDSQAMGLGLKLNKGEALKAGEVHLTTYDQISKLKQHIDKDTVIIFDESHSLKNWGSARAKHGYEMAKAAGQVMYATATPADKPLHITHLFRAKVFGQRKWEQTYKELGMHQVDVHTGGGNYIKQWQVDPRVGYPEVYRRMSGLFDRMIEDGLMLKREIALDGLTVNADRIELSPETHEQLNKVYADKLAETGGNKAVALMATRMAQEVHKISHVTGAVGEELKAGRSVIVFAARVNKTGDDEDNGEATEGTMKLLRESLEKSGVAAADITELHGGATKTAAQKAKAMEAFQSGKARVILATIESGGTGVNLDDTTGNAPRTTIVMTPPFSAVSNVQLAGRTWRLNTKSDAKIRHIFADSKIDDWNAALIARKMKVHGAVVGGEAMKLDVPKEEEQAEVEIGGAHTSPYQWGPLVSAEPAEAAGTAKAAAGAGRVKITGDTYTHKDRIKAAGGKWDADNKLWTIPADKADSLRKLSGLRFSDKAAATAPAATPAATSSPTTKAAGYAVSGNTFAHKDRIKAAGGRWDRDRGVWIIPATAKSRLDSLSGLRFHHEERGVNLSQADEWPPIPPTSRVSLSQWEESKHQRGQPGNRGQFGKSVSGGGQPTIQPTAHAPAAAQAPGHAHGTTVYVGGKPHQVVGHNADGTLQVRRDNLTYKVRPNQVTQAQPQQQPSEPQPQPQQQPQSAGDQRQIPTDEESLFAKADAAAERTHAKSAGLLAKFGDAGKWMKDRTMLAYKRLEARYGRRQAIAILAAGHVVGLATPLAFVPGSTFIGTLPFAALAETYLQLRRALGAVRMSGEAEPEPIPEEPEALTMEQVQELGRELIETLIGAWQKYHEGGELAEKELPIPPESRIELSSARAPVGGITIQGQRFEGGEFIPGHIVHKASKAERAKLGPAHAKPLPKDQYVAISQEQLGEYVTKALEHAGKSPKPGAAQAKAASAKMDQLGADRYEANIRGSSKDRAASRAKLLRVWGDGTQCPCIYCGLKLHESTVTRDKIYTAREGGRYTFENLLPACLACNQTRGDIPFREINFGALAK